MKFNSRRVFVMGILNVTPDSFYDGGKYNVLDKAIMHIEEMIEDGADIIDIGGESTRPGSVPVETEEEIKRVIPVIDLAIKKIKKISNGEVIISIDTYKSDVAKAAIDKGALIVNDISGLRFDKNMIDVVAKSNVSVIIMHMKGTPQNMQNNPTYDNVVIEIKNYFQERISYLSSKGILKDNIILDPGIGFGKTVKHNLQILSQIKEFHTFGLPILLGTSRKSFIGKILGSESNPLKPEERLEGSIATYIWAVLNGIKILRVHDVKETKRALKVIESIMDVNYGIN